MPKTIDRFPEGIVTPPTSKSIGHRALICAALAGGDRALRLVRNLGVSDDITATRCGILKLSAAFRGDGAISDPNSIGMEERIIDCGESGSTLRFLIPLAGLDDHEWIFRGRGRLMERPLDIYKEAFALHGGEFVRRSDEVRVCGPLRSGMYEIPGDVSSQFISGLLLALPLTGGDSEIILASPLESADYVRLTIDVMSAFGVHTEEVGEGGDGIAHFDEVTGWRVPGGQSYKAAKYGVEADWSQAAFFLCAGALGRRVAV
ncbi:MAG: 3-phosphoshikimate 1-carboxyvinyltransferase, partial [Clostridiales Family XIII bacterium]|nr:3-phosphoshikimate 1-carboxyvinyltransferase [Clostridiales Family XIII bacterium]